MVMENDNCDHATKIDRKIDLMLNMMDKCYK